MHALERRTRRERRLIVHEKIVEAACDQLILDRGEAQRTLGMARAHVVPGAIRMGKESDAHVDSQQPR